MRALRSAGNRSTEPMTSATASSNVDRFRTTSDFDNRRRRDSASIWATRASGNRTVSVFIVQLYYTNGRHNTDLDRSLGLLTSFSPGSESNSGPSAILVDNTCGTAHWPVTVNLVRSEKIWLRFAKKGRGRFLPLLLRRLTATGSRASASIGIFRVAAGSRSQTPIIGV